jgi:hypothetical protein
VWTNSSQRRGAVHEPMVQTQSLLAFLAGGPYGPSDGVGGGNRSLIMRSCREDGLLLRADKPVTMMDSAFTVSTEYGTRLLGADCLSPSLS